MTRQEAALRAVELAYQQRESDPQTPRTNVQLRQDAVESLHHELAIPPLEAMALVDEVIRGIIIE